MTMKMEAEQTAKEAAKTLTQHASLFFDNYDAEERLCILRTLRTLLPDAREPQHFLYSELYNQGEYEEAIELCEEALALSPNNVSIYQIIGESHIELGRYEKALQALACAEKLAPDSSNTANAIGVCHLKQERYEEAFQALQKAHELDPTSAYPPANMAELAIELLEFKKAKDYIGLALSLTGDDRDHELVENMLRLRSELPQLKKRAALEAPAPSA